MTTLTFPTSFLNSYVIFRQTNVLSSSVDALSQRASYISKTDLQSATCYLISNIYSMFFAIGY